MDCSTVPRHDTECGLGFCPFLTSVCGEAGRVIGREKVQNGGDQRPSQGSFLPWEEVSQERE